MRREAEDGRARPKGVSRSLRARVCDRPAGKRGGGHRGIVDDAIADHLRHVWLDWRRIGRDFGDLPRELRGSRKVLRRLVGAHGMELHVEDSSD